MSELDELNFKGHKSGYVALVGKPNVGKSTLLNHYIGQKVAAVSYKPQTTRKRQLGILTTEEAQIIFVDTPGLHASDYRLSAFINQEARYALMDADLILFIVDASQGPDHEDKNLAEEVKTQARDVKCLLVLNKMDLIDAKQLDKIEHAYQALLDFSDTLRISAITETGREQLLARIIQMLPEGPQYFPEAQITATYEREIAEDLIRAAALQHLRDEVPYAIFVRVNDYIKHEDGTRFVQATLFVERDSQKGIVIGKGGSMIKAISTLARQEIEEMSGEPVFLDLQVKVEKNWRNNPEFLKQYGLSHE
ncbi:MAG: GTPase Era [Anaerolineales bacterium]